MTWESWFKVSLPSLPILFSVFGVWLYWGENPLPVLAPSIAFWGVTISFYLFTQVYKPNSRAPFFLAIVTASLWAFASITSHNLALFLRAGSHSGFIDVLKNTDFWYSYVLAGVAFALSLWQFLVHEPGIMEHVRRQQREALT